MKVFRDYDKSVKGETLTVIELKNLLDKYPDTMPVIATWEGINTLINKDLKTEVFSAAHVDDAELCLVLDVNDI